MVIPSAIALSKIARLRRYELTTEDPAVAALSLIKPAGPWLVDYFRRNRRPAPGRWRKVLARHLGPIKALVCPFRHVPPANRPMPGDVTAGTRVDAFFRSLYRSRRPANGRGSSKHRAKARARQSLESRISQCRGVAN